MTHKFIVQWLLLLASTLPLAACAMPLTYSAEPIEARVIDADTQQPLAGVIVTANWQLEKGTPGGNIQVGQLMVMEAVTDKDGKFTFPGWGPKTVWKGFFTNEDPQLLLFKSGYEYQRLYNKYNSTRELRTRKVRRSDWSGKIIELKPFKGTQEVYARTLSSLSISLRFAYDNENCEMKSVPRMLITLYLEEKRFREAKVYNSLPSLNHELHDSEYQDKCGIRSVLRSYLP